MFLKVTQQKAIPIGLLFRMCGWVESEGNVCTKNGYVSLIGLPNKNEQKQELDQSVSS